MVVVVMGGDGGGGGGAWWGGWAGWEDLASALTTFALITSTKNTELIDNVDIVFNNSTIGFKFRTQHLIFPCINYKFYNLPWLFDLSLCSMKRLWSNNQVYAITTFCKFVARQTNIVLAETSFHEIFYKQFVGQFHSACTANFYFIYFLLMNFNVFLGLIFRFIIVASFKKLFIIM